MCITTIKNYSVPYKTLEGFPTHGINTIQERQETPALRCSSASGEGNRRARGVAATNPSPVYNVFTI